MKLNPETLKVDSFTLDQAPFAPARSDQDTLMAGSADRYCTLMGTCNTCWNTYCNCV